MAKQDDIPKTDPSEIDALIQRLKQSNLEPRDAQYVERLLRLALSMASLLQHKNASIKRLKRTNGHIIPIRFYMSRNDCQHACHPDCPVPPRRNQNNAKEVHRWY